MSWRKIPGGKAVKPQRRKTLTRRQSPKAARRPKSSAVDANEKIEILERRLNEALEQQTATSDVLKVISSSPGELQPVFDTLLAKATALCEASYGTLWLREADGYRFAALFGDLPQEYEEHRRNKTTIQVMPDNPLARIAVTRQPVQVTDMRTNPAYLAGDRLPVVGCDVGGIRTVVAVPMFKEGELIGAIAIYRKEVRPFTDKQVELVSNFGAQAVIAIENARLLSELRKSLQQQTATADVLKVISRSPGALEPIFDVVLETATRICGARFGTLNLYDGHVFRNVALHNVPPAYQEARLREVIRPHADSGLAQVIRTKQPKQIEDIRKSRPYLAGDQTIIAVADLGGARTILIVPMLKEHELIGVIGIYRQEVRPFTDKQVELVQNFAAQAVIAIENTRLLSELREALARQTATSEVLEVISSSPGKLEPVFDAMLENAARICEAKFGNLFLYENGVYRAVAVHGVSNYAEWTRREPIIDMAESEHHDTPLFRLSRDKTLIHITDLRLEESYIDGNPRMKSLVETAGARTHLVVPMVKDEELIGAIVMYRQEVRPFTDKQIELVQNFASQAVIAIENTRLLNELRESLQQQTATSEILASISGSMTDAKPVFDSIVRNLLRLFGTSFATVQLFNDGMVEMPAADGAAGIEKLREQFPRPLNEDTVGGQAMVLKRVVQVSPLVGNPLAPAAAEQLAREFGYNSIIAAPMIRQDKVIGAILCAHHEPRVFNEKEVALIKSFADQAVIAIENVRLFDEVQARTDDLSESLQQQTATADVLKVISRSAFDLRPVLDTLVESAARLCDADRALIFKRDGAVYRLAAGFNTSREFEEFTSQNPITPGRGTITGRAVLEGKTVHIPDVLADPEYMGIGYQTRGEYRSSLAVPLLREGETIGVFTLMRLAVRPYTEKQIELVTTFADQAVIAIENVRLFDEVQARTRDLAESLQQQTATADVLKAISRSAFDLKTVLDALVEAAARLVRG